MSSQPILIEFWDKTQHQVDTDELIATLPGDTIREKVIRYVSDILTPQYRDINKHITTQDGIHVENRELEMIRSLRNKLVDITFLQGLEREQEDKAAISEQLSPMIESISTLYSSMLVAYCHTELDALNRLRENLWQEVEWRQYDASHFNKLIDGTKNVETIASSLSRKNIRDEIFRECSLLRDAYKRIIAYNNDYRGRKARHQDT